MTQRQAVRDEHYDQVRVCATVASMCSPPHLFAVPLQLRNNELNRLLGLHWKSLTDAERMPFMKLADEDRQRYNEVSGPR